MGFLYRNGSPMDSTPAGYIRHRLTRFENAIADTRQFFSELAPFGAYTASAPYYERAGIRSLLDAGNADPAEREELSAAYLDCVRRLNLLEQELGPAYRECLMKELQAYVAAYHAAVCCANLSLVGFESDHDLFFRDRITVLVSELAGDHDLAPVRHLVATLDANLFPAAAARQTCIHDPEKLCAQAISGQSCRDRGATDPLP